MSYILDALKKSDQQRQGEVRPALVSAMPPYMMAGGRKSRSNRTMVWLLAILFVAVVMIAGVLLYPPAAAFLPANWLTAIPPHVQKPVDIAIPPPIEPPSVARKELPIPSVPATRIPSTRLMELWEISSDRRAQLETFNFSFHIYSDDLSQRTTIINGRRFVTGEPINDRWVLQEITQDGVIVRDSEGAVLLKVVEGW